MGIRRAVKSMVFKLMSDCRMAEEFWFNQILGEIEDNRKINKNRIDSLAETIESIKESVSEFQTNEDIQRNQFVTSVSRHIEESGSQFNLLEKELHRIADIVETNSELHKRYEKNLEQIISKLDSIADCQKQIEAEMHTHIDYFRQDVFSYFAQYIEKKNPLYTDEVRLVTDHPIAIHSNDHIHPWGTANDNTRAPFFIRKCEELFPNKKNLKYMDIGCAGGGIVFDALLRGHFAIGLEGSDYSLKHQRAEWRALKRNLFTCDVSFPFEVQDVEGNIVRFDVISAWEVLEHIPEDSLEQMIGNIVNHLEVGGIFVGTASQTEDFEPVSGAVLHVTIKPQEWWEEKFMQHGLVNRHDMFNTADLARAYGNPPLPWMSRWGEEKSPYIVMQKVK